MYLFIFLFDIGIMDLYIYFICGNYGLLLCHDLFNELKKRLRAEYIQSR